MGMLVQISPDFTSQDFNVAKGRSAQQILRTTASMCTIRCSIHRALELCRAQVWEWFPEQRHYQSTYFTFVEAMEEKEDQLIASLETLEALEVRRHAWVTIVRGHDCRLKKCTTRWPVSMYPSRLLLMSLALASHTCSHTCSQTCWHSIYCCALFFCCRSNVHLPVAMPILKRLLVCGSCKIMPQMPQCCDLSQRSKFVILYGLGVGILLPWSWLWRESVLWDRFRNKDKYICLIVFQIHKQHDFLEQDSFQCYLGDLSKSKSSIVVQPSYD